MPLTLESIVQCCTAIGSDLFRRIIRQLLTLQQRCQLNLHGEHAGAHTLNGAD